MGMTAEEIKNAAQESPAAGSEGETTLRLRRLDGKPNGLPGLNELIHKARKNLRKFDVAGYEEGVALLRQALDQSADFAPAHALLAEIYSYWGFRRELSELEAQSYYDLAQRHAEQALKTAPERADAHRALAVALRRGEKADTARRQEEILIAMDLDPNDAFNWYEFWRAFGYNPADPAVRRIQDLDPDLIGFHIDLGVVLCEQGRHREALRHLEVALKLNPVNSLALYNIAMVLDRHGWRRHAVKAIEKARKLYPEDRLIAAGAAIINAASPEAAA